MVSCTLSLGKSFSQTFSLIYNSTLPVLKTLLYTQTERVALKAVKLVVLRQFGALPNHTTI